MPLIIKANNISSAGTGIFLNDDEQILKFDSAQPYFLIEKGSDETSFNGSVQDRTIIWQNIISQKGNNFNTTTGKFTAPVTGVYMFHCSILATVTHDQTWWVINGSRERSAGMTANTGGQNGGMFDVIRLSANDTIGVHPYLGSATGTITANFHHTYWRGCLLG
jgi:hypothetical protein